jgi:DNA-binding CsgD family transcriptional regulator/tetratricopeptide (TPR) repeat protein
MHGHLSEGRRWIREALAKTDFGESFLGAMLESENQAQSKIPNPSQRPPVGKSKMMRALAKSLNAAGLLARYQGDLGEATTLCGQSLDLCRQLDDPGGIAAALDNLAAVARSGGNYTAAHPMYQESLAIYGTLNDQWGVAHTSTYLGIAIWYQGDLATAQSWVEEGLALFRALGVGWDIAMTLIVLAAIARDKKEYVTAYRLAGEALASMRKLGDRRSVALALIVLGDSCLAQGDRVAALPLFKESLAIFSELSDRYNLAECLMGVARAAAFDQPERSAQLCAAHNALHYKLGTFVPDTEQVEYQQVIMRLRTDLGEAAFTAAWTIGQAMSWDEAIQDALDILDLAFTATPAKSKMQPAPTATPFGQNILVGLTARELEVLRLVANGLTDAQIAEQLVISRRTVNTHLSSIYSKLGVNSRTAAVRYAVDHHLF